MSNIVKENKPTLAVAKNNTKGIVINNIDEAYRFAEMIYKTGLAPKSLIDKKNEVEQKATICAVVLKGMELGLPPMQSLQGIACINGALATWGSTKLALVKSSGKMKKLIETPIKDKDGKTIGYKCFSEAIDGNTAEHEFLLENAPKGKISSNYDNPWKTNPIRMCQMRARGFTLEDLYPDVTTGIYTVEEVMDFADAEDVEEVKNQPQAEIKDVETSLIDSPTNQEQEDNFLD